MARQKTVFATCNAHTYLRSYGRQRMAEFFVEGGPDKPCSPKPCRLRPGTDLFHADFTDDEADQLVRDWAANRAR